MLISINPCIAVDVNRPLCYNIIRGGDYMAEKNVPKVKTDLKLKLMGYALWYTFCFVTCFLISIFVITKKQFPDFGVRVKYNFLFGLVGGAVLEVILFKVVFKLLLGKTRDHLKETLTRIDSGGYTPEVMNLLYEGYEKNAAISTNAGYANLYALYLADAYIAAHDYLRAMQYNNSVNVTELFRYDTAGTIPDRLFWFSQRIHLSAVMGNIPECEQCMREAEPFFRKIRGKNPAFDYIADGSLFEYFFAIGDLVRCEALVTPYLEYTELKYGSLVALGRVCARKGDSFLANKYFDNAYMSAKNDYFKQLCENERRCAFGN